MAIHPLDDPALSALGSLAKAQRTRVAGIPSEAVGALREDFQQLLRDARDQADPQERPIHRAPLPEPLPEDDPALEDAPLPETYGAHGRRLPQPDGHQLDLKG